MAGNQCTNNQINLPRFTTDNKTYFIGTVKIQHNPTLQRYLFENCCKLKSHRVFTISILNNKQLFRVHILMIKSVIMN